MIDTLISNIRKVFLSSSYSSFQYSKLVTSFTRATDNVVRLLSVSATLFHWPTYALEQK